MGPGQPLIPDPQAGSHSYHQLQHAHATHPRSQKNVLCAEAKLLLQFATQHWNTHASEHIPFLHPALWPLVWPLSEWLLAL